MMASAGADGPAALSDEIREARAELDATIEEIRKVQGFETFLAAPTFDDVAEAAREHPLVYIAPADPGGLALIVDGTRVEHVPLPALSTQLVADRVSAYLIAHDARGQDRPRWVAALDDVTAWLWEDAMGPVLDAAKSATEIVIVAGGLLGMLPLHAAWMPDDHAVTGRRYALDLVTIRYSPNARALTAARRLAAETTLSTALVIVDPQPVRARALKWADVEGAAAAAAFPGRAIVRGNHEATEAEFRIVAPHVDVLHLACHGVARLHDPLESGLLLAGQSWLTLRELLAMRLNARLAVLSACETSRPGTDLPDEVVALPTGLLQAGVASVIASLWAVPDFETALLMARFYRGRMDLTPAAALQDAQRWMRDTPDEQKCTELAEASSGDSPWLEPDVAEMFVEELRRPGAGDPAGLHGWAGFVSVGA
jgi:hypothetical protein